MQGAAKSNGGRPYRRWRLQSNDHAAEDWVPAFAGTTEMASLLIGR
jgi:hypothetical protein